MNTKFKSDLYLYIKKLNPFKVKYTNIFYSHSLSWIYIFLCCEQKNNYYNTLATYSSVQLIVWRSSSMVLAQPLISPNSFKDELKDSTTDNQAWSQKKINPNSYLPNYNYFIRYQNFKLTKLNLLDIFNTHYSIWVLLPMCNWKNTK